MLENKSNDTYIRTTNIHNNNNNNNKNCRYMRFGVSALKMVKFHAAVTHTQSFKEVTYFSFFFQFFFREEKNKSF